MVMGLRAAKLAAGGPAAILEAQRMTAEKTAAMLEAQAALAMALATGSNPRAATRKAVAPYRRRVKANRRNSSVKSKMAAGRSLSAGRNLSSQWLCQSPPISL